MHCSCSMLQLQCAAVAVCCSCSVLQWLNAQCSMSRADNAEMLTGRASAPCVAVAVAVCCSDAECLMSRTDNAEMVTGRASAPCVGGNLRYRMRRECRLFDVCCATGYAGPSMCCSSSVLQLQCVAACYRVLLTWPLLMSSCDLIV